MENAKSATASDFVKSETLKLENRWFWWRILTSSLGYWLVSWYLNGVRESIAFTFLWILIAIQVIFYITIFTASYGRSKVLGFNKNIALVAFILLAILGRIENWEILILPILVVTMLTLSAINKRVS